MHVTAKGERLHIKAPPGTITPSLREQLVSHKADLLRLLVNHSPASSVACTLVTAVTSQNDNGGKVIDLRSYLAKLCQRLPLPPEHLLKHYFTADDLADIRAGCYPDPHALARFIKTDPRYPFGGATS